MGWVLPAVLLLVAVGCSLYFDLAVALQRHSAARDASPEKSDVGV